MDQPGRYFLIETPHWRIACLDTALGATHIAGDDAQLDTGQLRWLEDVIAKRDAPPLVLMSHHFLISGWGDAASSLAAQLEHRVKDSVFAWYWGHEHNCAAYPRSDLNTYYGGCVGNGSFIEKQSAPSKKPSPEWYGNSACSCFPHRGKPYRPHGYLELEFSNGKLREIWHTENGSDYSRELKV